MDIETRTMRTRLQSMSIVGFFLTFICFVVVFGGSVLVGWLLGPKVFYYFEPQPTLSDLSKNLTVPIRNLSKLNQQLFMNAIASYKGTTTLSIKVPFLVSIAVNDGKGWKYIQRDRRHLRTLKCTKGETYCSSVPLVHEPFIGYKDYNITVGVPIEGDAEYKSFISRLQLEVSVIDHRFTLFELWFRFTFLILTFIVVVLFAFFMRKFKWSDWTLEQRWVAILQCGLLGFNNPFFPLEIIVSGWLPEFIDQVLLISFFALLLYCWLVMFDALWKEASDLTFVRFYLPKAILIVLTWALGLIVWTWTELHRLDDAGVEVDDVPGFIFFRIVFAVLLIIYSLWMIYTVVRACASQKKMPYLGSRLKFFGVFTLIVILITLGGALFGYLGPVKNNAAEFLSFLSLFNLYVFILSFVYLPSKSAAYVGSSAVRMVRLDQSDEDEEDGPRDYKRATELQFDKSGEFKMDDDDDQDDVISLDDDV